MHHRRDCRGMPPKLAGRVHGLPPDANKDTPAAADSSLHPFGLRGSVRRVAARRGHSQPVPARRLPSRFASRRLIRARGDHVSSIVDRHPARRAVDSRARLALGGGAPDRVLSGVAAVVRDFSGAGNSPCWRPWLLTFVFFSFVTPRGHSLMDTRNRVGTATALRLSVLVLCARFHCLARFLLTLACRSSPNAESAVRPVATLSETVGRILSQARFPCLRGCRLAKALVRGP